MIEQGSEEWFQARLGKVTASRIKDVMAKGRGGAPSATRKNYMMELLCQRLTGEREESYTSAAMLRGTELEPIARSAYEAHQGVMVQETGFWTHNTHPDIGASPDGLVGDDGLLEIKCPNTAQHVQCLRSGEADSKYWWQMQCQMFCTGRKWCDFVSFDDRLPPELQLFVVRVPVDSDAQSDIATECLEFLGELKTIQDELMELAQ